MKFTKQKGGSLHCCDIVGIIVMIISLPIIIVAFIVGSIFYNLKFGVKFRESKTIYKNGQKISNCYRVYKNSVYAVHYSTSAEVAAYFAHKLPDTSPQNFEVWDKNKERCIGVDKKHGTIYIVNIPLKQVDLNTFKIIQINHFGYSVFGDKNKIYLVKGFPISLLTGEVKANEALKILTTDNVYTVKAYKNLGVLITSQHVYYNGVVLPELNVKTTKIAPFPGTENNPYAPDYVLYDSKSNVVYCNNKKVDLDMNNLAFYRYTFYSNKSYKTYNHYYVGDGIKFYNEDCTDILDTRDAQYTDKLVLWRRLY